MEENNTPAIVEEMAVVNVDKALNDWNTYQQLTRELLNDSDYQDIKGKRFKKKQAWRKYMRAFNISTRIVDKEIIKNERGKVTEASFIVRAWTPDGRESEGWGNCSKFENRGFNKANHDIPATAMTRATNRAISDLIGAGEVSAEEMENEITTPKKKPTTPTAKPKSSKPKSTTPKGIDEDKVVDAEITEKKPDWKALSQKSGAMKKVLDVLSRGGFDIDQNTVYVEANSMNTNGLLTDKELDEIEVILGKKPA